MSSITCDACGRPIAGYVKKKNFYTARRLGTSSQHMGNKVVYRTAYEGFQTHDFVLCEACMARGRKEDGIYKYFAWMFDLRWSFLGFIIAAYIIVAVIDAGRTSGENQFGVAVFLAIILTVAAKLLSEWDFVQKQWAEHTVNGKLVQKALYQRLQLDPLAKVEMDRRKQYKVFGQRDYRRLQRF